MSVISEASLTQVNSSCEPADNLLRLVDVVLSRSRMNGNALLGVRLFGPLPCAGSGLVSGPAVTAFFGGPRLPMPAAAARAQPQRQAAAPVPISAVSRQCLGGLNV